MSFSSIVALISDDRRAALSQLLAERSALPSGVLRFAADPLELQRAVTHGSLVMIEGSRLGELTAAGRHDAAFGPDSGSSIVLGDLVAECLNALPPATRAAFHTALRAPRAWSVKRVASAAGVSTRQVVRHWRQAACRVAPRDLLLAARLSVAQQITVSRPRSRRGEVAQLCGWIDARSLRGALRRAGFTSLDALARFCQGHATVSDFVLRLQNAPNE